MSLLGKIILAVVGLVAVVAAVVAVSADAQAHSERQRLDRADTRLATANASIAQLEKKTASPGDASTVSSLSSSLDEQEQELSTIENEIAEMKKLGACQQTTAGQYYQQLLGASNAGTDESAATGLLLAICPQAWR
jgi:septal ring factor EnvC (AmiA/AmiB activator)